MKIFYSWQMDAPRKINKDFIHGALSDAINKIGDEPEISEAERSKIELDQDTQGVMGSPEITRVIFDKIAAAQVIATDVSLVARGDKDKPHINSNVAIELGYAYGKLGDQSVLKIMNTHYGPATDLPFDLRNRRHPVQYNLSPDADHATISAERKKLVGALRSILLNYAQKVPTAQQTTHHPHPHVGMRGKFWSASEPLVPRDQSRRLSHDLYLYTRSLLYFRCIPLISLPELTPMEASNLLPDLKPLYHETGWKRARNKWGAISYDQNHAGDSLLGATQLFLNREIWAIDPTLPITDNASNDDDDESSTYIPSGAVQSLYPKAISSIREVAEKLGYGDEYAIEMGLSGAEGVRLSTRGNYSFMLTAPIFRPEVNIQKIIPASYPSGKIMNEFWEKLFSEVAERVPPELIWKDEPA